MFAATSEDLVMGLCTHYEMVPMPAPTPTPMPMPFISMMNDASQTAADQVTDAMLSAGGAPPPGMPVMVNSVAAANVGVVAKNSSVLPHIPLPPGVGWAPMPKPPKMMCGRMETPPTPDLPVQPAGDAVLHQGSQLLNYGKGAMVRMGHPTQSCSEPMRQQSTVIAVPKGPPVLIMK
jgi:hypothetical protein